MLGIITKRKSLPQTKLLAAALAFACTAGAELQLRGSVTTSAEGDTCHKVVSAMLKGIEENPDWFAPLSKNSSVDDFQLHAARLSDACPVPREARAPAGSLARKEESQPPAGAPAQKDCHTSVGGEACHESVVWAMRVGIAAIPDWYAPLAKNSSFEDFQRHLHGTARLSHVCPEPCDAQAPDTRQPAPEDCHTTVKGEACYESVASTMRTCAVAKSTCYFPLTKDSSFEDFQRYLRGTAGLSHVCPEPCAARA